MYSEDSELLFVSGDEDLRRVYLSQNEDSAFTYDIFESNENFIPNKSIAAVPTFEGKKAKLEISPAESTLQYYFSGKYISFNFLEYKRYWPILKTAPSFSANWGNSCQ